METFVSKKGRAPIESEVDKDTLYVLCNVAGEKVGKRKSWLFALSWSRKREEQGQGLIETIVITITK